LSRTKGAALAAAALLGFFLVSGTLQSLSATPTGVFGIVAVLAILLGVIAWRSNRR
jgi:hypothetical protein